MMLREPGCLTWVLHRALGNDAPFPPAESWRSELAALKASRLTSLAAWLLRPQLESLPRDVRVHLEAAQLMGESVAERSRSQLAEAALIFNRLSLDWAVLKGWALASRLYPSPACRPSGDLDLLVAGSDLSRGIEGLLKAGYRVEGEDQTYHTRLVREESSQGASVIELHHRCAPPGFAAPETTAILARRRSFESRAGLVWVPAREDEIDLLVRHYLRHAGDQAILLLDLLLALNGERQVHPLGSLVGDDLERLGFGRAIDGPRRWHHAVLRRWMARRTFEERRSERHAALVGIPLALASSPLTAMGSLARVIWPSRPTPRWLAQSRTAPGYAWRLKRLVRLGR
jgi:hypothetical protein